MTKSLTIDMGNSSAKLAIYDGEKLVERQRVAELSCDLLASVVARHGIDEAILSSVTRTDGHIDDYLHGNVRRYLRLSHSTPLPIGVKYATPGTLGSDRVAAAVGAWHLNPRGTSLVVDAGTAATIDVVDAQGNFLGGNIVAGITTRLKALNHYTSALPLVGADGDTPAWGCDTATALRSGAVLGLAAEVEATAARVKEQLNVLEVTVFVTGGDASLLARYMRMEARVENDLLSNGLYRILRYNEVN